MSRAFFFFWDLTKNLFCDIIQELWKLKQKKKFWKGEKKLKVIFIVKNVHGAMSQYIKYTFGFIKVDADTYYEYRDNLLSGHRSILRVYTSEEYYVALAKEKEKIIKKRFGGNETY